MSMSIDWSAMPPPQPSPDVDTAPFWAATAAGQLAICRCQDCGLWLQPPLERCRACAGPTVFEPVRGTGVISTFVIQRQAAVVGYFDKVPYAVALVDLDEQRGLRLPGRVVGIEVDDVAVGMRVQARIQKLDGGDFSVAVFEPAG